MSKIISKIAKERYLRGDEKSMDDVYKRVAKAVAQNVPDRVYPQGESAGSMSDATRIPAWEKVFYELMVEGIFLPNTPTLSNAGTKNQMLSACFGLPVNDSFFETGGIMDGINNSVRIMKMGGGVGYNFSHLRPAGSPVKSTDGVASGPVSFMKFYNAGVEVVKQGGRRRGAAIGILNVDHPDIKEFITCKAKEGDISNLNISVMVTDDFMNHVHDISGSEIFNMIIDGIYNNGEPGVLFYDTINEKNPNKHLYNLETVNPCGEVPIGVNPATGGGEACNLGSINVSKFYITTGRRINFDELSRVIYSAVVFLDTVISMNEYPTDAIGEMTRSTRKIGLGFMGLHDLLIKMNHPYDSQEGRNVAEKLMKFIYEEATTTSHNLAYTLGNYPKWEGSEWSKIPKNMRNSTLTCVAPTGTLSLLANCSSGIEPYFNWVYERHNTVGSTFLITVPLFEEAMQDVANNLIDTDITKILYRDFDVIVFELDDEYIDGNNKWLIQDDGEEAPGDIREKLVECIKQYCLAKGTIRDLYFIPKEVRELFKSAMDIKPEDHIKMQSYVQKYCDNSISKTINIPNTATKQDVRDAIIYAWRMKCKGFTMYRDGSRQDVVLKLKDEKKEETPKVSTVPAELDLRSMSMVRAKHPNVAYVDVKIATSKEKPDRVLPSTCFDVCTGCGDMYVHVAEKNGQIRKVFINNAGNGGCEANTAAIGRLISLGLKHGVPVREVIKQLGKVKCNSCTNNKKAEGKSCADIIGKVMQECIPDEDEKPKGQTFTTVITDDIKELTMTPEEVYGKCPVCGGKVMMEGRCFTCPSCSYSKCA